MVLYLQPYLSFLYPFFKFLLGDHRLAYNTMNAWIFKEVQHITHCF